MGEFSCLDYGEKSLANGLLMANGENYDNLVPLHQICCPPMYSATLYHTIISGNLTNLDQIAELKPSSAVSKISTSLY